MRHDTFVTCDDCGVVAAPGPPERGGYQPTWFASNQPPPGWLGLGYHHQCVQCQRKSRKSRKS